MSELFTNNAASVLASGISDSATSVTVSAGDGAGFPSPTGSDYFRVVMIKASTGDVEIAKVVTRTTDVLDFDNVGNRGLEGTTPLVLNANDIIELRPTAAFFNGLTNAEEVQEGSATYGIDSGAADAYVLTMTPTTTAYTAGQRLNFIPLNPNTGASTVNVDTVGVKDIISQAGNALVGTEINGLATIEYDGSDFILLDPALVEMPEAEALAGTAATPRFATARRQTRFPATTKMVFAQAAAPTGWTQDATNDRALRVVSSSGGGTGGTNSIASTHLHSTANHTLTTNEIPSHRHTESYQNISGTGYPGYSGSGNAATTGNTGYAGGGAAHNHGNTGNAAAFKYADVIFATKD